MSEPNKKMEELLKRYAQERKAESSAPFELHPATRKMLHGEVTRTFPKRSEENRIVRLLWPRLAIAAAFTAMLVCTVVVLNKPKRKMELAQNSTKTMAPVAVQSRVSEGAKPVLEDSANKAASSKRGMTAAPPPASAANLYAERKDASRTRALDKEPRPEANLSEPIQQNVPVERGDVLADKKVPAKSETAKPFARTESVTNAVAAAAPQSPAVTTPKTFSDDAESPNRWRFIQQDLRAKYRQNFLSPAQPKILESFELVRTRNKIRLIEKDGSIYEGDILPAAQDRVSETDSASREQNSEFAFRAVGTNQQLNRLVSFTGIFAFTNRATENAPVGNSGALTKQKSATPIGIVRGKVSIAGTNEFQIRAVESGE